MIEKSFHSFRYQVTYIRLKYQMWNMQKQLGRRHDRGPVRIGLGLARCVLRKDDGRMNCFMRRRWQILERGLIIDSFLRFLSEMRKDLVVADRRWRRKSTGVTIDRRILVRCCSRRPAVHRVSCGRHIRMQILGESMCGTTKCAPITIILKMQLIGETRDTCTVCKYVDLQKCQASPGWFFVILVRVELSKLDEDRLTSEKWGKYSQWVADRIPRIKVWFGWTMLIFVCSLIGVRKFVFSHQQY